MQTTASVYHCVRLLDDGLISSAATKCQQLVSTEVVHRMSAHSTRVPGEEMSGIGHDQVKKQCLLITRVKWLVYIKEE